MDSSSNSELDDLSDLTIQHLNINKKPAENEFSLSKLTAKYSKLRSSNNVLQSKSISTKSNLESTLSCSNSSELKNYSVRGSYSSDDDSSDSEFKNVSSLTKLTAKYSKPRTSNNLQQCEASSKLENTLKSTTGLNTSRSKNLLNKGSHASNDNSSYTQLKGPSISALAAKHNRNTSNNAENVEFQNKGFKNAKAKKSDDESSGEEFSSPLAALAAKHKVQVTSGSCGLGDVSRKALKDNGATLKSRIEENIESSVIASDQRPELLSEIRFDENHDQSILLKEFISPGNLSSPKLKDIIAVKHIHRQHSKSESDGFSINNQLMSNKLNKSNLESETSTSLGSLKGGTKSTENFQFSLGCSIPSSFKSTSSGKGLASSLSNIKNSSLTDLNNSFSDPDISTTSKQKDLFSGINLASAIKSPSHTSIPAEDSMMESEDDEIVTLLDTMNVDEEIMEKDDLTKDSAPFVMEQLDCCNFDTTNALTCKLKLQTKQCSSFGKLVCKRWKPLKKPYIRNKSFMTTIIPFNFSTASPDDEIAHNRERRQ